MNGKTHKIRRRPSVVVLAASVAAFAIPAATAGGGYHAGQIPGKLGSPDPRDSAAAVLNEPSLDAVQRSSVGTQGESFAPRVVDRLPEADDEGSREILRDAAQEHGAAGFGNTTPAVRVAKAAPSVLAPDYSHLPPEDRSSRSRS